MLLKVCLNGSREPGSHPALPITPTELAEAARAAIAAGAGAIHMHPRGRDGSQSLAPADVAAALDAVRAACPGVPVGTTTIAGIAANAAERLALVRAWTTLPDFVSLNYSEEGAVELCEVLLQMGIGVEAGLEAPEDARILIGSGRANDCLRIMIEPNAVTVEAAFATVQTVEAILDAAHTQPARLLDGQNAVAWPVLDLALERGYDARIGLEDTLALPDGMRARDNAELVAAAHERAVRAGRL